MNLKDVIRTVPDWPIKGVMFRDITTLLQNPDALAHVIEIFYNRYKDKKIDSVVGIDARGFIFGSILAYKLKVSFVPVRKKGKLPAQTISAQYSLEYGKDAVEMHSDAVKQGDRIILIDDLIATGGTMKAAADLVGKLGGIVVECAFVIELPDLKGREKLKGFDIFSLIEFEGD